MDSWWGIRCHGPNYQCGDCPFSIDTLDFELCGDGIDNDGNGLVDEQCGKMSKGTCKGKPVSVISGNMTLSHTDFSLNNSAIPITFTRTYNSRFHPIFEKKGFLGYGWRHNYDSRISLPFSEGSGALLWHRVQIGGHTLGFLKDSNGVYQPQRGAGGYQLREVKDGSQNLLYWELISPTNVKMRYDATTKRLTRITIPSGAYLKLTYKNYVSSKLTLAHGLYLKSVMPYFKADGPFTEKPAGKGIQFQYTPYDGYWRIQRIATMQPNLLVSCTNDSGCSSGEICIKTIPQQTHSGFTYGNDATGFCGKRLLKLEYSGGSIGEMSFFFVGNGSTPHSYTRFMPLIGTERPGNAGSRAVFQKGGKLKLFIDPTTYVLSASQLAKAYRNPTDDTKDFITYEYQPNTVANSGKMLNAKDATGKVLESHQYDSSGRATTSVSADGHIQNIEYDYSASGNKKTSKITLQFGVGNTQIQYVTYNKDTGQFDSQSGACDCSMAIESRTWKEIHGYVLPESIKMRGKTNTYKTIHYTWRSLNGIQVMASKTENYGDNDTIPNPAGSPPSDGFQIITHYHKLAPGIPVALITHSSNSASGAQAEVIYDYDAPNDPNRCPNPSQPGQSIGFTCDAVSGFNKGGEPTVLYRTIVRGYTKKIGNSNWVPETRVTNFEYNAQNQLVKTIGPRADQVRESIYYLDSESTPNDSHYRMLKESKVVVKDPRSNTTVTLKTQFQLYSFLGVPTQVISPSGAVTTKAYDAIGRIQQVTTDQRHTTSSSVTTATSTYTRDYAGRVIKLETPLGAMYHYGFDSFGRPTTRSFQAGTSAPIKQLTNNIYNEAGQILEVQQIQAIDSSSQVLKRTYEYLYGSNGKKIIKVTSPRPNSGHRELHYNADGTLAKRIDENGQEINYEYHPKHSRITKLTRYLGPGNTNPIEIGYVHNQRGELIEITDRKGVKTKYEYDDFGQRIQLTSPDRAPNDPQQQSVPLQFEYDLSGNLVKKRRPDGTIVTYMYDTLNRLVRIDYPSPPAGSNPALIDNDVNFYFGETSTTSFYAGRLSRVTVKVLQISPSQAMTRTTRYLYDAPGRIVEKQVDDGGTVYTTKYEYDKEGRQTDIHYPYIPYHYRSSYNLAGQLTQLEQVFGPNDSLVRFKADYIDATGTHGPGGILDKTTHNFQYTYLGSASPTGYEIYTKHNKLGAAVTLGTGGSAHKTWSAGGTNVNSALVGHTGIQARDYSHNKTGLIDVAGCLDPSLGNCFPGNEKKEYKYDGIYRLTEGGELVSGQPRYAYQYDANGNLKKLTDRTLNGQEWNMDYASNSNRLVSRYLTGQISQASYSQRSDGNRSEDQYWLYTYHTNGRLAVMTPKAGNDKGTVVFGYDHTGKLIHKIAYSPGFGLSNTSSMYHYDQGGRLLVQVDLPNNQPNAFREQFWLWAGGSLVGGHLWDQKSLDAYTTQNYNYHLDHLGRPTTVTSAVSLPVWRSKSTPYGRDKGYSLKDNPFVEIDISHIPIERINYQPNENDEVTRAPIKAGTYAIQFYFDVLDLEPGNDVLFLYNRSGVTTDEFLHSFTGKHQTGTWGNPGTPFWGPVVPLRAFNASDSNLGELLFRLTANSYNQEQGYRIIKYRLWHIPDGDRHTVVTSDSPATGALAYNNSLGENGTAPWQRDYSKSGAKMSRVCFSTFNVEHKWDFVQIRDKDNHIIQVLTGTHHGCSAWVQGDTVRVLLFSDATVQGQGFTVSSAQFLMPSQIKARLPGHWFDKDTEVTDGGCNAELDNTCNVLYAGLHYNWHRFYDPNVGRYISPDPLGLKAGMNPYLYALGNPVNAVDENGLHPLLLAIGFEILLDITIQYVAHRMFSNGCTPFQLNWGSVMLSSSIGVMFAWFKHYKFIQGFMARRRAAKRLKEAHSNAKRASKTGCFIKGTLVSTPKGLKKIEDLQVGDIVSTNRAPKKNQQGKQNTPKRRTPKNQQPKKQNHRNKR